MAGRSPGLQPYAGSKESLAYKTKVHPYAIFKTWN